MPRGEVWLLVYSMVIVLQKQMDTVFFVINLCH